MSDPLGPDSPARTARSNLLLAIHACDNRQCDAHRKEQELVDALIIAVQDEERRDAELRLAGIDVPPARPR